MSQPITENVVDLMGCRQIQEKADRGKEQLGKMMSAGREILQIPRPDGSLDVHKCMEYVMQQYSCSYDRIAAVITLTHDTMMPVLSPQAAELLRNLLDAISSAM